MKFDPCKKRKKKQGELENVSLPKEGRKRSVEETVALWVIELFNSLKLYMKKNQERMSHFQL